MKCSGFIATSVDGFIARPDGDIDWLHRPEYAAKDGGDFGYGTFINAVDALVMGRNTFEKVMTFDPWPYEGTPVVVLTRRPMPIPDALAGKVCVESGPPEEVLARLAARGHEHLYIDGGATIQRFLQAGLIDEITINQVPILLGGGIPLFGSLGTETPLELIESVRYANGFVISQYRMVG